MSERSPFAYGYSGRLLTSTAAHEVFCCSGDDEAPHFIHPMDGIVMGVRNVHGGVLACDDFGSLVLLLVPEGRTVWRVELGVTPSALAATESGHWAAVHDNGVVYGHGPKQLGTIDKSGTTAAAYRDEQTIALVGSDGQLELHALDGGRRTTLDIGSPCKAVVWCALGWWLVASEQGVHRIEADASAGIRFLKWSGKPISALAVSQAGGLCAFVTEDKYVCVFGVVRDINCGAIVYSDRNAYELEFGPDNLLGVGIGMGDGNKIDLTRSGAVSRTDPPPDRPRNRWMLQLGYDPSDVEEALKLEREYQAGRIRFEGATMITTAGPAAAPATSQPSSESPAEGSSSTALLVVGVIIVVAAALLWWLV